MLPLDDPRWAALPDAYLTSGLPGLLRQLLEEAPHADPLGEGWEDWWERGGSGGRVWSLILHQGTVYPATIAAFPHLVRAVASLPPGHRAPWLSGLAELEAMRAVGTLHDPDGVVDAALEEAYHAALQAVVPLAVETLATHGRWPGGEVGTASMLALLAFARGDRRLGFVLARWWPYALVGTDREPVPLATLEQYEELTGKSTGDPWTFGVEEEGRV